VRKVKKVVKIIKQ